MGSASLSSHPVWGSLVDKWADVGGDRECWVAGDVILGGEGLAELCPRRCLPSGVTALGLLANVSVLQMNPKLKIISTQGWR